MKRADIEAKIREEIILQVALDHQMEGTQKLYEAAMVINHQPSAANIRENLHTLLDSKLDSISTKMLLTRQLASVKE